MMRPSDESPYFFKIDTAIKRIRYAPHKRFTNAGHDLADNQWLLIDHPHRNPGISHNRLGELTIVNFWFS